MILLQVHCVITSILITTTVLLLSTITTSTRCFVHLQNFYAQKFTVFPKSINLGIYLIGVTLKHIILLTPDFWSGLLLWLVLSPFCCDFSCCHFFARSSALPVLRYLYLSPSTCLPAFQFFLSCGGVLQIEIRQLVKYLPLCSNAWF